MEGVRSLISRIRDVVDKRSVDIENELMGYDRKKSGIISPVSLHRWLSSLGMNLSSSEINALVARFSSGDGVDWKRFCSEIQEAKGMNETLSSRTPMCVQELQELGSKLVSDRQNLREVLKPFDASNKGRVSTQSFYRALGMSQSMKTIVKHYADTVTGDIDYLRLQNDIKNIGTPKIEPDAPISELPECFEVISHYIRSRSVDMFSSFSRADPLNAGKIPRTNFESIVSSFGVSLSPLNLKEISSCFYDPASKLCNYKQFINTIDTYRPKPTAVVLAASQKSANLPPKINIQNILQNLKKIVVDRRISVQDYFARLPSEGFDNYVPSNRFKLIVQSMSLSLERDEIQAISQFFSNKEDEEMVDYVTFLSEISPEVQLCGVTSDDVLSRLREFLDDNQIMFSKTAARYDREGSGEISVNQLISTFSTIKFEATTSEISMIQKAYPGNAKATIKWRDLSRDVDPDIQIPELPIEGSLFTTEKFEKTPRPNPTKSIIEILRPITHALKPRKISIYDEFRQHDKFKHGTLNQAQFSSIIMSLPIEINPSDLRMIVSYYRLSGTSNIQYENFAHDVENCETMIEDEALETLKSTGRNEPVMPEITQSVHNFMKRFKSFAQIHRISPTDIFEAYDTSRNGRIPVFKVGAAFNNVQFEIPRQELENVVQTFRDPKKRELFDYQIFIRAYNEEDITSEETRMSLVGNPISAEVQREAMTTAGQIREKLLARNRRIGSAFSDLDTETIPSADFQERLANLGIVLRAGQLSSLFRKYRVGLTDNIKWQEFCYDVEQSKTIGSQ